MLSICHGFTILLIPSVYADLVSPSQYHQFKSTPHSPDHDALEDKLLLQPGIGSIGGGLVPRPPPLLTAKEGNAGGATASSGSSKSDSIGAVSTSSSTQQHHHRLLHVHNHASGTSDEEGNEASNANSNTSSDDNMVAISMAAAAAASYQHHHPPCHSPHDDESHRGEKSGHSINEKLESIDDNYEDDELVQPIMIPSEQSSQPSLPSHHNQQQQQQHSNSLSSPYAPGYFDSHCTNAQFDSPNTNHFDPACPTNTNNSNANNTSNQQQQHNIEMLHLLKTNLPPIPKWEHLPSIMNFINSFHYNNAGAPGGVNPSVNMIVQREELLIYLATDDCAYLRRLLRLFYDNPPPTTDVVPAPVATDMSDASECVNKEEGTNTQIQGEDRSTNEDLLLGSDAPPHNPLISSDGPRPLLEQNQQQQELLCEHHQYQQRQQARQQYQYSTASYHAILATIIKSILLLNDPEIIEYVTSQANMFEAVVKIMEYDPELQQGLNGGKVDYIKYIRDEVRFRTVIRMDDDGGLSHRDEEATTGMAEGSYCANNDNEGAMTLSNNNFNEAPPLEEAAAASPESELILNIHRLFRVNYIRDILLRPTMDEGSLSTLVSLGQFTMSDIIRGVMLVPQQSQSQQLQPDPMLQIPLDGEGGGGGESIGGKEKESYLIRIICTLGNEISAIRKMTNDSAAVKAVVSTDSSRRTLDVADKEGDDQQRHLTNTLLPKEELSTPSEEVMPQPSSSLASGSPAADDCIQLPPPTIKWTQHCAPQDTSLPSRLIRRKGCLLFLNELFSMARNSLQPHEKDEFIDGTVKMNLKRTSSEEDPQGRQDGVDDDHRNCNSTLLSYLSATLSDPTTDKKERSATLDMLGAITMHDPSLIRMYCLNYCLPPSSSSTTLGEVSAGAAAAAAANTTHPTSTTIIRPKPNDSREVLFTIDPNDLLLSLIYIMTTEEDAGLLLQASEIIRIVLDTEIVGDSEHDDVGGGGSSRGLSSSPNLSGGGGFVDDAENDFNAANSNNSITDGIGAFGAGGGGGVSAADSEQNAFLALFYDRYIQWLVAPFQYKIVVSRSNMAVDQVRQQFEERTTTTAASAADSTRTDNSLIIKTIEPCHVRSSFTLEILSFCVRAHVHRMKFFLLRTRVLGTILKSICQKDELRKQQQPPMYTGVRCLKLAALK